MAQPRVHQTRGQRRSMPRQKVKNPGKLFRRIFRYVSGSYLPQLIIVAACIVITVLASVQGTLFTRTLIDSYITPLSEAAKAGETVDYGPLLHAIGNVAIFYAIGVVSSLLQAVLMTYVTQGTMKKLRIEAILQLNNRL